MGRDLPYQLAMRMRDERDMLAEISKWQTPLSKAPVNLPLERDIAPAAVLIMLANLQSDPVIVLTKRAAHLKKHAGQISFPGGRVDSGDESLIHTALREAEEEIAMPSHLVDVRGFLPDMMTGTGYRVTPVVGLVDASQSELSSQLVPEPQEVDDVIFAPAATLLNRHLYSSFEREHNGRRWTSWRIDIEGHIIWGATAAILHKWANQLS